MVARGGRQRHPETAVLTRVLVVGPGDLGRRMCGVLASLPEVSEVILAGRAAPGAPRAALADAGGAAPVRFAELDAADAAAVEALLRRQRPALLVHCASALSPWIVPGRGDPPARALGAAGFALQLPAQLPLIHNVMTAVKTAAPHVTVANCSYPDVTHPVLAAAGLAPTVGLGNAAMIRARVLSVLRARGGAEEPVRVLAHHAHVTPAMCARPLPRGVAGPRVYLGEDGRRDDALAFAADPLPSDRSLNALPAASSASVFRALLGGPALRTSLPGPAGLPGGYPVHVESGQVRLDLPPALELGEAVAHLTESSRLDGVERIDADGTVHFTGQARAALASLEPRLAEPLRLDSLERRCRLLLSFLGLA